MKLRDAWAYIPGGLQTGGRGTLFSGFYLTAELAL